MQNTEKLDELMNLMKNAAGGKSDLADVSPDQLAEIVKAAGIESFVHQTRFTLVVGPESDRVRTGRPAQPSAC
jgi:hypothetical protein